MPVLVRAFRLNKKKSLIIIVAVIVLILCFKFATYRYEERYIATLSWVLNGRVIVIDPGHGGYDPGALGSKGIHEKEIVLDVSKNLADILRQAGAEVLLTRENDIDLSDPGSSLYRAKEQDMTRRVDLANRVQADIFLSIHCNSFPDGRQRGAQTFSQPGSEESKKLAVSIQRELNRFLEFPGREAKQVDYFTGRMTKMPSVIVEIGFISNNREENLMLDQIYQNKIAWSIYAGVARYLAQSGAAAEPAGVR